MVQLMMTSYTLHIFILYNTELGEFYAQDFFWRLVAILGAKNNRGGLFAAVYRGISEEASSVDLNVCLGISYMS